MPQAGSETVLLVCNDESISTRVLTSLHAAGMGVVGPTPRAATALALTAQIAPTVAILAGDLTGKRSASELAEDLMSNWGVRSWIWDGDIPFGAGVDDAAPWAARGEQLQALRTAFGLG